MAATMLIQTAKERFFMLLSEPSAGRCLKSTTLFTGLNRYRLKANLISIRLLVQLYKYRANKLYIQQQYSTGHGKQLTSVLY